MKNTAGPEMAVLDFSGTLSPGAARFAYPQNLERALQESGLAALGLDRVSFWNEIINPAWADGSSGALGYEALLFRGTLRLNRLRGETAPCEKIEAAAARFTDAYLQHSTIDSLWAPLLTRLAGQKSVIIATDHYTEATPHITGQLEKLGLAAAPAVGQGHSNPIIVANSADLGFRKETFEFWDLLRRRLKTAAPQQIFLVDDFGCNEQPGDSYGAAAGIGARRERTVTAIESSWGAPVRVFPFLLHREKDYPALVASVTRFLLKQPST